MKNRKLAFGIVIGLMFAQPLLSRSDYKSAANKITNADRPGMKYMTIVGAVGAVVGGGTGGALGLLIPGWWGGLACGGVGALAGGAAGVKIGEKIEQCVAKKRVKKKAEFELLALVIDYARIKKWGVRETSYEEDQAFDKFITVLNRYPHLVKPTDYEERVSEMLFRLDEGQVFDKHPRMKSVVDDIGTYLRYGGLNFWAE